VTASEFAFLALGLILGVATGAALIEILRGRPPAAREVRVTVAQNSIHARRAATLANDTFPNGAGGPATGGPGDRLWNEPDAVTSDVPSLGRRSADRLADQAPHGDLSPTIRTPVHATRESSIGPDVVSVMGVPVMGVPAVAPQAGPIGPETPSPLQPAPVRLSPGATGLVAVPMSLEPDPITQAFRATAAKVVVAAGGPIGRRISAAGSLEVAPAPPEAPKPVRGAAQATALAAEAPNEQPPSATGTSTVDRPGGAASDGGPCAEERRVADERCAVANRAREGAAAAADALRVAHRTYDGHVGNAETAATAIDPRSVRTAKETAQQRFRQARAKAMTRDDVEAAARAWLGEINEINRDTREAGVRIERDRAAATALAPVVERLAVEADAARISAERADEACIAAREAVAACDEARTLEAAAAAAATTEAPEEGRIAAAMPALEDEFEPAPMGSRAGDGAVLLRILRGDHEAMMGAVARLSGDDAESRRRWQTWLSGLAEALIARSIEASALDFPIDHFFWGPFSQTQNRDIAAALASLGYRFDGFGGWFDERVPSQRDLSMAVGYSGLDPMRIRRWPTEPEMRELLQDVRVAADEYIAGAAGGLTLGELVTLLGRRADAFTELWNEWGTVRPILLEAV
jgi:hypothetical protein